MISKLAIGAGEPAPIWTNARFTCDCAGRVWQLCANDECEELPPTRDGFLRFKTPPCSFCDRSAEIQIAKPPGYVAEPEGNPS